MKDLEHLRIMLFSDPDYEELVSEIYYDKKYVAVVHQDRGKSRPTVVLSLKGDTLREIDLHWLQNALQIAAEDLLNNSIVPDVIEEREEIEEKDE